MPGSAVSMYQGAATPRSVAERLFRTRWIEFKDRHGVDPPEQLQRRWEREIRDRIRTWEKKRAAEGLRR